MKNLLMQHGISTELMFAMSVLTKMWNKWDGRVLKNTQTRQLASRPARQPQVLLGCLKAAGREKGTKEDRKGLRFMNLLNV